MSGIRNVAVLSHSGAGKTSLVEAILYRSGGLTEMGMVEDGNTASDYNDEEKRRKISIYSSVFPFSWQDHHFNLIDTPGYADFVGEIRGAQVAADAALIIVSAVSGVAVGTERVWNSSNERELSRIIVINKMDRDNADFYRTMSDIESSLDGNIAAIQIPLGQAEDFRGIVDLLHMKAYAWPDGKPEEIPLTDDIAGLAQDYRDRLVEAIVETDDELMMLYLDDAELDPEALHKAFYQAVRADLLTPVVLTSATEAMGIELLMDFMTEGIREISDHAPLPTISGEAPKLGLEHPFSARVFKTVIDPYMGKVSLMRVLSGSLRSGDNIVDSTQDSNVKVQHIYVPHGKDLNEVKELQAGMIGALNKIDDIKTGDTLVTSDSTMTLVPIPLPSPIMALALSPKSRADEDKLGPALHKLLDEDATLVLDRNAETHETVLWGMGHVHLEVAINKLKQRYNVEVETHTPKIAYRETIKGRGDFRYRHKKQSGGAGQFGEVALRVEPLPRNSGFEFANEVVGGSIPTQFIPSCEKGIEAALNEGSLAGFQVVDVKATVYDGKHHPVDSKDIAFQIAAAHAFKDACKQAKPILLEPVMLIKVRIPERFTGDIIGDLNTRRGRVLGMDSEGSVSLIIAHVPLAEVQMYSPDLRSITGGRGAFSMKFDHYDEVPQHIATKVLAEQTAEVA